MSALPHALNLPTDKPLTSSSVAASRLEHFSKGEIVVDFKKRLETIEQFDALAERLIIDFGPQSELGSSGFAFYAQVQLCIRHGWQPSVLQGAVQEATGAGRSVKEELAKYLADQQQEQESQQQQAREARQQAQQRARDEQLAQTEEEDEKLVEQVREGTTVFELWKLEKESPAVPSGDLGKLSRDNRDASRKKKTAKIYRRRDFTDKDLLLLQFLAKFRYANSTQLAHLFRNKDGKTVTTGAVHRRLLGLEEAGLIGGEQAYGARKIWFIKQKGINLAEDEGVIPEERFSPPPTDPDGIHLGNYLGISQVAIQILGGFFPRQFPNPLTLDDLIGETEINSAFESWKRMRSESHVDALRTAQRGLFQALDTASQPGEHQRYDSLADAIRLHPEVLHIIPLVILQGAEESHKTDLVVLDGDRRIYVEVETSKKAAVRYRDIMHRFAFASIRPDVILWFFYNGGIKAKWAEGISAHNSLNEANRITTDYCKALELWGWDKKPLPPGKAWRNL